MDPEEQLEQPPPVDTARDPETSRSHDPLACMHIVARSILTPQSSFDECMGARKHVGRLAGWG